MQAERGAGRRAANVCSRVSLQKLKGIAALVVCTWCALCFSGGVHQPRPAGTLAPGPAQYCQFIPGIAREKGLCPVCALLVG